MPEDKGKAGPARRPLEARRGGASRMLRIVGGTWRSRRFRFPAGVEIRPTPDRVRETLFNWLAPGIRGTRCLDLFAGSGALGLEALSRGAAEVVFVERHPVAARAIEVVLGEFGGAGGRVVRSEALGFLHAESAPFGLVFLDPPFATGLVAAALQMLLERRLLLPGALVYREFAAREAGAAVPAPLVRYREGRSGEVGYDLLRHSGGGGADGP